MPQGTEIGIRINKYLSEMGICSRREADRLIESRRVRINNIPAVMGQRVLDGDIIHVDGKTVEADLKDEPVVIAYNKPRGIVCTTAHNDKYTNIIEAVGYRSRVFPVGRLDQDSEGLILLTNRGELVNAINRGRYGHEKEYIVTCRRKLTEAFLGKMRNGVEITIPVIDASESDKKTAGGREYVKVITRKCSVEKIDDHSFNIVLTQGLNRQIRRMCDALGNCVARLKRIRVMNIELNDLKEGEYRIIGGAELAKLESLTGLRKNGTDIT